jgi:hypothetical protein
MEKISWTNHVKNEDVLHRVKEERNIIHTISRRNAICAGHILFNNYLLKYVIKVKIEGLKDKEKDAGIHSMTLRKRDDTGN